MAKSVSILLALAYLLSTSTVPNAAAGPAQYRTGTIDPRAASVAADIQRGVFSDPDRFLEPLVRHLGADAKDDFHKVKILHDWIAENIAYDVDSFFSGAKVGSSPGDTLRRRKGVCHGYATLLQEMCALAGVPCERIRGFGRGYGFAAGRSGNVDEVNHAWNAVQIDGRWHLIDVTWDAGHVEKRAYRKQYNATYLFMEPGQFIYTHLPSDPKWQLLARPLAPEQFADLPYLRGLFFDHGMRLATQLHRVTRVGESVQFSVVAPSQVELMAKLTTSDGRAQPRRTLLQRDGDRCKILTTFPQAGRWTVQLFSRPRGSEGLLILAASLDFQSASGSAKTFPKTYGSFGALDGYLYSPLFVPLATDKPLLFKVRLYGASGVSLAIGDKPWLPLAPSASEENVYELTTAVPPGARARLNAKKPSEGTSYTTLIDFTPQDE